MYCFKPPCFFSAEFCVCGERVDCRHRYCGGKISNNLRYDTQCSYRPGRNDYVYSHPSLLFLFSLSHFNLVRIAYSNSLQILLHPNI